MPQMTQFFHQSVCLSHLASAFNGARISDVLIKFPPPDDGKTHEYCTNCQDEAVERVGKNRRTRFRCGSCRRKDKRRIMFDPAMVSWVATDRIYWHESTGVFVRDQRGKFLFFKRNTFPSSARTVPSGHVDTGEQPELSAARELLEETGLEAHQLKHVASYDISGDSCRRGSDHHRWHAYLFVLDSPVEVKLSNEGRRAVWLTLAKARKKRLTYPVRYIIERHAAELEQLGTLD